MQLVYFWVEKYGVLENQGINFNSGFYFEMRKDDNKYILERKEEKEREIPNNFFGKNIENISCIIGINGSGKTTLFRSIMLQKYTLGNNHIARYLSIFKEDNKLYIYKNLSEEEVSIQIPEINRLSDKIFIENIKYVYFNNDMQVNIFNAKNIFDISPYSKLSKTLIEKEVKQSKVAVTTGREFLFKYDNEIFEQLVSLIFENKKLLEKLPVKELKNKIEDIIKNGKIYIYLKDNIYKIQNEKIYKKLYSLIGNISDNLIDNFIDKSWKYLCNLIEKDIDSKHMDMSNFFKRDENEDISEWFLENLKILDEKINIYSKRNQFSIDNSKFIETLNSDIAMNLYFKEVLNILRQNEYQKTNDYFTIKFNSSDLEKIKDGYKWNEIFSMNLNRGFSSGELAYLNLLKDIIDLKNQITLNGKPKNIIFFIEELESFMHPEWQRQVVNLMKFLSENISWMKNIKIQYIFTSHTPFLIGDIPGRNINYFQDEKILRNEHETFGGNIYDILEKNFLMRSYYGEFSIRKIENFIEILSKDENGKYDDERIEKNKDELLFIIDNFGEELLKSNLEKIYLDYLEYKNKEIDLKKLIQIQKIKNDIKKLNLSEEDIFWLVKGDNSDKN
ncbi:MAG: AAA family ATPase [Aeromonas sp.]